MKCAQLKYPKINFSSRQRKLEIGHESRKNKKKVYFAKIFKPYLKPQMKEITFQKILFSITETYNI